MDVYQSILYIFWNYFVRIVSSSDGQSVLASNDLSIDDNEKITKPRFNNLG